MSSFERPAASIPGQTTAGSTFSWTSSLGLGDNRPWKARRRGASCLDASGQGVNCGRTDSGPLHDGQGAHVLSSWHMWGPPWRLVLAVLDRRDPGVASHALCTRRTW